MRLVKGRWGLVVYHLSRYLFLVSHFFHLFPCLSIGQLISTKDLTVETTNEKKKKEREEMEMRH